jgi:hydrogenase 3 maturation protease
VFEGGVAGLSALALFDGCKKVVIVDAARSGREPGTLHRFLLNECEPPGEEFSTHQMGVKHILAALIVTAEPGPTPEVVFIGAEVGRIDTFTDMLTPPVRAALEGAVSLIETECRN